MSLRSRLDELEEAQGAMELRPQEAREELASLRRDLDQGQANVPANASPMVVEANRLSEDAVRQDLSARIENTQQELLSLPTREAIASAQQDLVQRELARVERAIAASTVRINQRRRDQAVLQEREARQIALRLAGQPAPLRTYAETTAQMRTALSEVSRSQDGMEV